MRVVAFLCALVGVMPVGAPQDFVGYAEVREKFASAVQSGDLKRATAAWRALWQALPASLQDGGLRTAVTSGPALDAATLDRVERWLEEVREPDDLQLRVIFDLRDLCAVAMARAELDAAMERLAKDKVDVVLPIDGKARKGVLRREKSGEFNLYEKVDAGEVGHKLAVRVVDLLSLTKIDRNRRKAPAAWRQLLGEVLLRVYDDYPAVSPESLVALRAADVADPRARMGDYLRLLQEGRVWTGKLLGKSAGAAAWYQRGRRAVERSPEEAAAAFAKAAALYAELVALVRETPPDAAGRQAWLRQRALGDALRLQALLSQADATFRAGDTASAIKLADAGERAVEETLLCHSDPVMGADMLVRLAKVWRVRAAATPDDERKQHACVERCLALLSTARARVKDAKTPESRQVLLHAAVTEVEMRLSSRHGWIVALAPRVAADTLKACAEERDQEAGIALRLLEAQASCRALSSGGGNPRLIEELAAAPLPPWAKEQVAMLHARYGRPDAKQSMAIADSLLNAGGDSLYRAASVCRYALPFGSPDERAHLWHLLGSAYYLLCRWPEAVVAFGQSKHADAPAGLALALERMSRIDPASQPALDEARKKTDAARMSALERAFDERRARWIARGSSPRTIEDAISRLDWPLMISTVAAEPARATAGEAIDDAVRDGLRWLSRHQGVEGSWSVRGYTERCNRNPRFSSGGKCTPTGGHEAYEIGVTGLALLAFLRAGHGPASTETADGICFGDVVTRGLLWLMKKQDGEGALRRSDRESNEPYMYDHLLAGAALAEACAHSQSPFLREAAQKAMDFTLASQNPGKAWGYSMKSGDNTTAVTAWAVVQMDAALRNGLTFRRTAFDGTRAWLDEVSSENDYSVGYRQKGYTKSFFKGENENFNANPAPTAMALYARMLMDSNKSDPRLMGGRDALLKELPRWTENDIDYTYWFFGTLALYSYERVGSSFKQWNARMLEAVVKNQNPRSTGCKAGSWETVDRWSCAGGRVYAVAMNVLTLAVHYRR